MHRPPTAFTAPAALLLALGLTACQGGTTADSATTDAAPSASAASSETASPGEADAAPTAQTVSAMDIKVGDCLIYGDNSTSAETPTATDASDASPTTDSTDASDGTVASASLVDCASPHLYEVYAEGAISADGFPVGGVMEQYVADICYDAFEAYVGISYDDAYSQGRYAVTSLRPTQTTWAQGDRTVSCILTSVDGSELTGSARGADG